MNQDEKSPLIADIPEPLVSKSPDRDSLIHQPAAPVVPFEGSLMDTGWLKLHRKICDSSLFTLENSHFKLAITLLLNVNWQPKKWYDRIGKKEIEILPGQMITSINSIMEMAKTLSPMQIRTGLANLEKLNFITQVVTKQFRLISIINWDTYQNIEIGSNIDDNKAITKQQQSGNKAVTITKEVKNGNNVIMEELNTNSFAPVKPERKVKKESKPTNPDIKTFIDWYFNEHQKRLNQKLVIIGGRDGSLVGSTLKNVSLAELQRRAGIFLESDRSWMSSPTYDIPALIKNINAIDKKDAQKDNADRPFDYPSDNFLRQVREKMARENAKNG
jgi:hypothetical protein